MKKVTRQTTEGLIIDIATDSVIGWKCNGCSTAYVDRSIETTEHMTEYIGRAMNTHSDCQR